MKGEEIGRLGALAYQLNWLVRATPPRGVEEGGGGELGKLTTLSELVCDVHIVQSSNLL